MAAGPGPLSPPETPSAIAASGLSSAIADRKMPVERLWRLSLALIFVLSTSLCLWFNFSLPHVEYSFIGDSGGYIQEAEHCLSFGRLNQLVVDMSLTGKASFSKAFEVLQLSRQPLPDLRMNGPVFPLLIASVFAISGKDVGANGWHPDSWYVPVIAQCFLLGLNCALIALIGRRLWDRKVGVTAGLLAACYPGFIVNSSRITTETFASTLMLLLLLLFCKFREEKHPWLGGFSIGSLLVISQLTRSVLVLQWLTVVPTAFIGLRRGFIFKSCLAVSAGAILFTAPWMAWQDARFGQPKPLLDRAGVFNLYVGNDPDRQGWLSLPPLPPPEITRWSNVDVMVRSYKASPAKFIRLQFDKPPRMFKTLWNDFRTAIGPVSYGWQVCWHQILLTLAVVGALLGLACSRKDSRLVPRLILFEMLAMHAVYFVFAPVARYNHTAMPEILLLAAVGLVAITRLFVGVKPSVAAGVAVVTGIVLLTICERADQLGWIYTMFGSSSCSAAVIGIAVIKFFGFASFVGALFYAGRAVGLSGLARWASVPLALLLFPFLVLPMRTYGRVEERHLDLGATSALSRRQIKLSSDDVRVLKTGQPYIAIDAQGLDFVNNNVELTINGKPVDSGVIPGAALLDAGHYGEIPPVYNYRDTIFGVFNYSTGSCNTEMRQWFYLPVDASVLTENGGSIELGIRPKTASTVQVFGSQRALKGFWSLPSFTIYSFDKAFYGSETDEGVSDPRFDDHVPVGEADAKTKLVPNLFLVVAPPVSLKPEEQRFTVLQRVSLPAATLRGTSRALAVYKLRDITQPGLDDIAFLRLRGQVRTDGHIAPGIDVLLQMEKNDKDSREWYLSEYSPRLLPASRQWRKFDVMIPFSRRSFWDKSFRGFTINLNATGYPRQIYNIYPAGDEVTQFKDMTAELYRAPGNPLTKGFRVF